MFLKPEPGFSELEKKLKSFSQKSAVLKEVLLEFKGEPDEILPGKKKRFPSQDPTWKSTKIRAGMEPGSHCPPGLAGRALGCSLIPGKRWKRDFLGFECGSWDHSW